MKNLVECVGEEIKKDGITTRMYLNYRINKEDLHYLTNDLYGYKIDMDIFDYTIMTYNQLSERISLEFKVYEFGEMIDRDIVETLWTRGEFFRIISLIEE